MTSVLGSPRLHLRSTDSTNDRARALAATGAPHGLLVTAGEQTAGRGRQGRSWSAPPGRALLMSLLLRRWPPLLPIAAAVAVAEAADENARIKWPNDVLLGDRKLAGILVEARPQEGWAIVGIGVNVAVREDDFPPELRTIAATLGLDPTALEPTLARVLAALKRWLDADAETLLEAYRARDALAGRAVSWANGEGRAMGIDERGRLVVAQSGGGEVTLAAGEIHLGSGYSSTDSTE